MNWRRLFKIGLISLVGLTVAIQAVPYGRAHDNPPVRSEPQWDSPVTRDLVVRACFDCHSNETIWPWYANIAPISWLTTRDVDEGRDELNFSEWGSGEQRPTIWWSRSSMVRCRPFTTDGPTPRHA